MVAVHDGASHGASCAVTYAATAAIVALSDDPAHLHMHE